MSAAPARTVERAVPRPAAAFATRGRGGRRRAAAGPLPLRLAAALVGLVCLLPVLVVLRKAFDAGPAEAFALLWRPRVAELLVNTVALVVITCLTTMALGVGAAWLVERTTLPGARWWRVALVAPLAVPAFVNSFVWADLAPGLDGLAGAVLVTSLSYFPFVFLPVAVVLRSVDQGLEEAARTLGLGPWRTFARVVLAEVRPAVLGGSLLVGLHLLAEFGALEMMRFPTLTTAILGQVEVAFDDRAASVLGSLVVAFALALLTLELLARGRSRYARVGSGAIRRPVRSPLGATTPLAVLGVASLTALSLAVPVWSLGRWLLRGQATQPLALVPTVSTTVALGLGAAVVTTVVSFPAAWLLARRRTWLAAVVERVTYVAAALPGVVVALALITLTLGAASRLYQTSAVLLVAYVVLFVPRAMVSTRAAIAQTPPELADAARALGDRPAAAFWRVQLPLTLRGAMAGSALVFIAVSTELTATLLLAPTGTQTLATAFWQASSVLDYAAAAPYGLALVLLSAPVTFLVLRGGRGQAAP